MSSPFISATVTGDIAGIVTLPKQIVYAAFKTCNETAEESQTNVILLLNRGLHIRGNWIKPKTRFGINVTYAKKDKLVSEVYTRADWLLEEEGFHGGIKHGEQGHRLSDPDVENTRHGIQNVVRKAEKARVLLANSAGKGISLKTGKIIGATGAFKIRGKSGKELILQRVGATKTGEIRRGKRGQPLRSRGKNGKVVLKYVLRQSVKVPTPEIFQHAVIFTTRERFSPILGKNLVKAIKSARIK